MNYVDFGFTESEKRALRRKADRDTKMFWSILAIIAAIAVILFHYFVLPNIIPNLY